LLQLPLVRPRTGREVFVLIRRYPRWSHRLGRVSPSPISMPSWRYLADRHTTLDRSTAGPGARHRLRERHCLGARTWQSDHGTYTLLGALDRILKPVKRHD